jgi:hypothetical protein
MTYLLTIKELFWSLLLQVNYITNTLLSLIMAKLSKYLSIGLVVILTVSSLMMVNSVNAQTNLTIPTPAVPEFSVGVVDHSYDIPTTTTITIDPYTGEEKTNIQPGYHVENFTTDITIKNQPFKSDTEGLIDLFFNIRVKGHYEQNWTELFHITGRSNDNTLLRQSHNQFTVYSYFKQYPAQGVVEFQVEAFIAVGIIDEGPFGHWVYKESGWSPTQTITIGDNYTISTFSSSITNIPYPSLPEVTTESPSPTPTPTVPEFPITATLIAVLAAVSLLLIIGKRKQSFNH